MTDRPRKQSSKAGRRESPSSARGSRAVLWLPAILAGSLATFSLLPSAQANARLGWSILAASAALAAFTAVVAWRNRGRRLLLEKAVRSQHYLQACAQATVLAYWGYYWPPVYDAVPLIAAQLVFAYAFDMLLAWTRRDTYSLGFSPFPVIFSTNLFLWFKADWFYLQFLMIAVGFAAKDLIRWERDGRHVHIFNPSSFPLALFSLGLVVTGTTSMTWGEEIATTQFNPPNMYVLLFLVGLPGQFLFGVTTMTLSAVVTTYLFGLAYFGLTGTYFFIDSYIPIAVFLGMHLLFTDPSTAPRSEVGRIAFGMLYGLGNVALYSLLGVAGVPKFYDKLLPVPLMNLSVRFIDRVAPRILASVDPARLGKGLVGRRRNLAYMSVWASVFILMSAVDGLGDNHPGHKVPFWLQACQQDRSDACTTLGGILSKYCLDGSGWACNERGVLSTEGNLATTEAAAGDFSRACTLEFTAGCQNLALRPGAGGSPQRAPPRLADYPIVLPRKGALPDLTPVEFFTRACDQGWVSGCDDLAGAYLMGNGVARDVARARTLLEGACAEEFAAACSNLGYMYQSGDGVVQDTAKALTYLKQSCDLGYQNACRWLAEQTQRQN